MSTNGNALALKPKICILYSSRHPGGFTTKVANLIKDSIDTSMLAEVHCIYIDPNNQRQLDTNSEVWEQLDAADLLVFGSPTYMGSVYSGMKAFFEKTSGRWSESKWCNKLAAGFTNSSFADGDKSTTINQMMVFACQHGMLWVSLGIKNHEAEGVLVNRFGAYMGLMLQAKQDSIDPGDELTARMFGKRLAEVAKARCIGMR